MWPHCDSLLTSIFHHEFGKFMMMSATGLSEKTSMYRKGAIPLLHQLKISLDEEALKIIRSFVCLFVFFTCWIPKASLTQISISSPYSKGGNKSLPRFSVPGRSSSESISASCKVHSWTIAESMESWCSCNLQAPQPLNHCNVLLCQVTQLQRCHLLMLIHVLCQKSVSLKCHLQLWLYYFKKHSTCTAGMVTKVIFKTSAHLDENHVRFSMGSWKPGYFRVKTLAV